MVIPYKQVLSVGTYTLKALRNWRLCQCSNRLFPLPLARLCRSNKRVCVVAAYHARVMSDARHFQKRPAAGGRRLALLRHFLYGRGFDSGSQSATRRGCWARIKQFRDDGGEQEELINPARISTKGVGTATAPFQCVDARVAMQLVAAGGVRHCASKRANSAAVIPAASAAWRKDG